MNTLEALSLYVNIISVQVCVQYRGGASPKCDNHWSVYLHTDAGYVVQVSVKDGGHLEWTKWPKIPASEIKILGYFATTNVPQVTTVASLVFGKGIEKSDPNMPPGQCDCRSRIESFVYHLSQASYLDRNAYGQIAPQFCFHYDANGNSL